MIILNATRVKESYNRFITIITTDEGKVKGIFNNSLKQPRKGRKTIILNNFTYGLRWAQKN
jgi:hypothetical protein